MPALPPRPHPMIGVKRNFSDTWKDEPEIVTIPDKAFEKFQKQNEKSVPSPTDPRLLPIIEEHRPVTIHGTSDEN